MENGNTATISPVSEVEMSQIQNLFKKAADTIVAFSSLTEQVERLQAQVNDLSNQVTRYRNHIDTQDDAMYRLRQEREDLTKARNDAEAKAEQATHEAQIAKSELEVVKVQVSDLDARVTRLMKDRDDAEFRAMELEDKLKKSEDMVAKFKDFAKGLGMITPEPKPEPVKEPEPTPPVQSMDEWWTKQEPVHDVEDPWTSAQKAQG
ncbi:MAG TPA: hypothetical protein VLG09_05840 [Candidatus Saccharimonadales bacterium]|nr:hypothetical protein [Candidatus Saccharimonadales bacterium]